MAQNTTLEKSNEIENMLISYVKTLPESLKTQFPNASINLDSLLSEGLPNVKNYLAKAKSMDNTQIDEFIANFNNTIMHPDVKAYLEKNNLGLLLTQITEYINLLQTDTVEKKEFISQFTTEYTRINDLTIADLHEVLLTKGGADKNDGRTAFVVSGVTVGTFIILAGALTMLTLVGIPVGIIGICVGSIIIVGTIRSAARAAAREDPDRDRRRHAPIHGGKSKSRRNKKSKRKYILKRKKTNKNKKY